MPNEDDDEVEEEEADVASTDVRELAIDPKVSGDLLPEFPTETLDTALQVSRAIRATHIRTSNLLSRMIAEAVAAWEMEYSQRRRSIRAKREILPLLKARNMELALLADRMQQGLELAVANGHQIGGEDGYPADVKVAGTDEKVTVTEKDRAKTRKMLRESMHKAEPATMRVLDRVRKKATERERPWGGPLDANVLHKQEDDDEAAEADEEVA